MRVPGPGTHEVKDTIGEAAKAIMGARLRGGGSMDLGTIHVPGPGAYSPNKRVWDPAIEKTMGGINHLLSPYEKAASTKTRSYKLKASKTPGPGTYTVIKGIGSAIKIGTSVRIPMGGINSGEVPSAAAYDQSQSFVKRSLLGGSFGKAMRMKKEDSRNVGVPGPG